MTHGQSVAFIAIIAGGGEFSKHKILNHFVNVFVYYYYSMCLLICTIMKFIFLYVANFFDFEVKTQVVSLAIFSKVNRTLYLILNIR